MDDETENLVVLVLLGIFSVTGSIGNALVIYIYSRKRDITTSSLFILTLAGTDLFTCLIIIPYNIVVLYLNYTLYYELPCKLYMFLITCNVPFSAFVMVAIAFDRYFCICHPFLHAITIPRAKIIVMIMGVFACILGIMTSLTHGIFSIIDPPSLNITINDVINSTMSSYISQKNVNDTLLGNSSVTPSLSTVTIGINETVSSEPDVPEGYGPGMCAPSTEIFNNTVTYIYQKIYAGFYLISFLIVLILYGLIYRSIHIRRALKAKRKRSSLFPASPNEYSAVDTQMTVLNNGHEIAGKDADGQKKFRKKSLGLKEKVFYANIRTAAMLFIVTIVFLIAFLPSWLMAHDLVPFSKILFYMYFIYNVANPIIYAFMNTSFRDDLQAVFKRICNSK
ncbi:uncharacterized protein LOC143056704 [Mytilus galloprovincialis]|uniref:uncharacterized protein LOC143056704 n=1 Tax=Mytilus galloprovincialis TaxID=29158 RepID=UPI003F7CD2A4